jgi:hypothetical protein
MSFSNVTGCYYQKESNEYPKSISYQQLWVLHVAANYMLRLRCGLVLAKDAIGQNN